ncbi:MAG TPA: caspase family protein, partial [Accumulibacter sp.]
MPYQRFARFALCLMLSLLASSPRALMAAEPTAGGPRVALVVGNGAYRSAPLVNPAGDARAVAERLRQAGFAVTLVLDVGRRELHEVIRRFGDSLLRDSRTVGVFYYAGHGV